MIEDVTLVDGVVVAEVASVRVAVNVGDVVTEELTLVEAPQMHD